MKCCTGCKEVKPLDEFQINRAKKDGLDIYCKSCTAEKRKGNKKQRKRQKIRRDRKLKTQFISNYGGKCICCDEFRIEFLTIAHLNGYGKEHREELGTRNSSKIIAHLKSLGWPKKFKLNSGEEVKIV